jgi:hypothetical protein
MEAGEFNEEAIALSFVQALQVEAASRRAAPSLANVEPSSKEREKENMRGVNYPRASPRDDA